MMLVRDAAEAQDHLMATGGGAINNPLAQAAIWAWFRANLDKQIVKVWVVAVRVRHLRILFELLAGPEPQ